MRGKYSAQTFHEEDHPDFGGEVDENLTRLRQPNKFTKCFLPPIIIRKVDVVHIYKFVNMVVQALERPYTYKLARLGCPVDHN